ncbi:MAG: glycosyltransferase [Lysobacter sp.]|nr:glycosyltransferase [Lysobacter sp.]
MPIDALHVVPHIDDEASGPSYSVPRLCQSLAASGHRIALMCLAAPASLQGVTLEVHPQWRAMSRFAVSPALARALGSRAREVDVVHNHSLWSMANVSAGWVVPGARAKLVTSPRGTLSTWALGNSRQVKRLLWPLQRRALTRADMLHATSPGELQEIRALGLSAPVAVIPNGVDLPAWNRPARREEETRTLLFLSRIHPKKGIDMLLRAWQVLQDAHPRWRLVIAGRGEPQHVQQVESLAQSLQLRRVAFPGPVYGAEKSGMYFGADLFVLPTHSENFGMVVAEALAHGCPAIVSRGAPWAELEPEGCGWWVEPEEAAIAATLDRAMRLSDREREAMGLRGREWMDRDFSWTAVAARMAGSYAWLLGRGDMPEWVSVR